jgi:hypothetical protein
MKQPRKTSKRETIIQFIRENSSFHKFVNFDGHNLQQLIKIKREIKLNALTKGVRLN